MFSAILSDFKSKYEGLSVPYPADTTAASMEGQAKEAKANYDRFIADSTARVGTFKEELAKWEEMMPISEVFRVSLQNRASQKSKSQIRRGWNKHSLFMVTYRILIEFLQ